MLPNAPVDHCPQVSRRLPSDDQASGHTSTWDFSFVPRGGAPWVTKSPSVEAITVSRSAMVMTELMRSVARS